MKPEISKAIGAAAYPFRGHLLVGSLVLMTALYVAAFFDFKAFMYGLRFGGPLLSITWAALCCSVWFPPTLRFDTPLQKLLAKASMQNKPLGHQNQASLMVAVMLVAMPALFIYGSFQYSE